MSLLPPLSGNTAFRGSYRLIQHVQKRCPHQNVARGLPSPSYASIVTTRMYESTGLIIMENAICRD